MRARNINHLIEILDEIIEKESREGSPMGYFPALYRKVTVEVKDRIKDNYFEDGKRMENLDVGFANRYLEAYYSFQVREPITKSWELAFRAAGDYHPIVLQHLFLGMNAHINLDLGIVASEIAPGRKINGLKNDFDKINDILASLVDEVQNELSKIWPLLKLIDAGAGKIDEAISDFSIDVARRGAWNIAKDLAQISKPLERKAYITAVDKRVYEFGKRIYLPRIPIKWLVRIIRWTERGNVTSRIGILR